MKELLLIIGLPLAIAFLTDLVVAWIKADTSVFDLIFKNKSEYKMNQSQTVDVAPKGKLYCKFMMIKDFPTISFNQFLDFYYLNPSSWTLKECRVCKNNDNNLSFTFTYEDWKKYKKWREQLKKDTESKRINDYKHDVTKKILEAVQVDIENIRAESQKDLEKAQELMKEVKLK